MSRTLPTALFSLLLLSAPARAEDAAPPPAPPVPAPARDPELAPLLTDLGDPSFAKREAASEALAKKGEAARDALQEATHSLDPEVQSRARTLLATLDAKQEAEHPKPKDPRQEEMERLRVMLGQRIVQGPKVQVLQPNRMAVQMNVNGRRMALDQDDLDRLETLKGKEIPSLGLQASLCPEELADQLKIKAGVLVRKATEGAPPEALQKHDLILEAAGAAVSDLDAFQKIVEDSDGKPLELKVLRKGEKLTLTVTPHKVVVAQPLP